MKILGNDGNLKCAADLGGTVTAGDWSAAPDFVVATQHPSGRDLPLDCALDLFYGQTAPKPDANREQSLVRAKLHRQYFADRFDVWISREGVA